MNKFFSDRSYVRKTLSVLALLAMTLMGLSPESPSAHAKQATRVVLIVLEGVGQQHIESRMPHLARMAKEGAVTWSAASSTPPLTVPAMASLLTGLPVNKHRVTAEWENYDFARSFLRSPTVFDYMDLAGGLDSAVFFMDERLYQLSRPEIYVDSQMCGTAKPNCTPQTVALYVHDYFKKVTSEGGHGFRLFRVPDLLLVHLPAALHVGRKKGWSSPAFQQALESVDQAIGEILQIYGEFGVLDETMFIITSLNRPIGPSEDSSSAPENGTHPERLSGVVPWIGWGANVKPGLQISRPISLQDTGATILYALGLQTHTEWDSHAITDILQSVPERRTTENELSAIY